MNELQIIEQREVLGKKFKIYGDVETPLFLAKDVAEWIEHSNHRTMVESVDDSEKIKHLYPVNNPYGGYQEEEQWFLTEDGLYEILMQSRKPIARQFKHAVKEILRSIRKHGMYATPDTLEKMISSPEFGIKLLTAIQAERERNRELEAKIEQDQPKVEHYDQCAAAQNAISMRDVAAVLNIPHMGRNKLFEHLRKYGVLDRNNVPYRRFQDQGLFRVVEASYIDGYGDRQITTKTLVNPSGLDYIRRHISNEPH